MILIMDFGGQTSQLIGRRVREAKIYCEIVPYSYSIEKIKEKNVEGIIFSGGPNSVYEENSPKCDKELFELGIPILGICYGSQLMAQTLGGKVNRATSKEYGKTEVDAVENSILFNGLGDKLICWMSHTDFIEIPPKGFNIIGSTSLCPVAAMENREMNLYGVQFHPEVEHTEKGRDIIGNFLFNICKCNPNWDMKDFINSSNIK